MINETDLQITQPTKNEIQPPHIAHVVKPNEPTHKPKLAKECNFVNLPPICAVKNFNE